MEKLVPFLLFCQMLLAGYLKAQVNYLNHIPVQLERFQIVLPLVPSEQEILAAVELQKYLEILSGIRIPTVSESAKMKSGEFIIGNTNRGIDQEEIKSLDPDEFVIRTAGTRVAIAGGKHKGALYGVYELLEKYLGCRFWAPGEESIPSGKGIDIPVINIHNKPAFSSREVYYAGMDEQDFTDKMRTDRHAWKGGEEWGLWVHTMFTLVPPDKYFESNPDFYAQMEGKRSKTQLCLTNPEVLKITIEELGRRMKEQPQKRYWSVSQMDTFGSCECGDCRKIDEKEGSSSGTMINFVNQVAEAFPEKVISTLAYQYTRKAPAYLKPAENVNIMLCTIECDRSKPLESVSGPGSFLQDLIDWSALSNNILVWDYVIQFTNMIAPFPNLPVLQPNIQLFGKYGVAAVFEQGCHGTYSENQELRQYLLAKLLWNPHLNVDSIQNQFLEGYYGAAAPFIRDYLHHMEKALQQSGQTLWIYSSPMEETNSFMSHDDVATYNMLFDQAEDAVAGDSALMRRVVKARLPLRYSILEIAKKHITGADGFLEQKGNEMIVKQEMTDQLGLFVRQANQYGVKTLHERKLTPDAYQETTLEFFRNAYMDHLAKGKLYTLESAPGSKYTAEGDGSLTDGKRGSPNYFVLWQGFEGVDFTATVDLGELQSFNYVGAEFLQDLTSWIFYPRQLKIGVSDDGQNYRDVAVFDSLSCSDMLLVRETGKAIPETKARFVRFSASAEKVCPPWHIGHGGKSWLFVDELIVDRRK